MRKAKLRFVAVELKIRLQIGATGSDYIYRKMLIPITSTNLKSK